jgi:uncharacterized repeat protein (TIGR01451 family)
MLSGNRLTYTIAVINNGPQDATGITVTDALPGSLHFNSVSSSQGTCTRSTATNPQPKGTVTCSVGNRTRTETRPTPFGQQQRQHDHNRRQNLDEHCRPDQEPGYQAEPGSWSRGA